MRVLIYFNIHGLGLFLLNRVPINFATNALVLKW